MIYRFCTHRFAITSCAALGLAFTATATTPNNALAQAAQETQSPVLSTNSARGPIEISADELEVRQPDQMAIFKGNVLAVQGEMNLKSDKMTVYYRAGEQKTEGKESISRIDVDGNVFITNPTETASGAKGIYDVDKNEIRLLGGVTLTRGSNVLKGSALVYDMNAGRSVLTDGGNKKKRVRALFVPGEKK